MNVVAKCKVESITKTQYCTEVQLQPVSGPGNESWSKWTPSGLIKLQITNPEAINQFDVGKVYFVNFEEITCTH